MYVLLIRLLAIVLLLEGCATQPAQSIRPTEVSKPVSTNIPPTLSSLPPVQSPTSVSEPTIAIPVVQCTPTIDDGLSPSYKPDAAHRSKVGEGHVLSGVVRSSETCLPIANVQIELWPEYAGQGHPDSSRATVATDSEGKYQFICDQPEHIHMRISAPGYRTLANNSYHPEQETSGTFDIVLVPIAHN